MRSTRESLLRAKAEIARLIKESAEDEQPDVTIVYKTYNGPNGGYISPKGVKDDEVEVELPFGGTYQCFDSYLAMEEEREEMSMDERGETGEKHGVFDLVEWVESAYVPMLNEVFAKVTPAARVRLVEITNPKEFNYENTRFFGALPKKAVSLLKAAYPDEEDLAHILYKALLEHGDAKDGGELSWYYVFENADNKWDISNCVEYDRD